MGAFPQWMDQHPRSIVDNETTTTTITPDEAAEEYKIALQHIAELYTFISPVLPTVTETERTIRIYRQEGQKETNAQNKEGHKPETEKEESGEDNESEDEEITKAIEAEEEDDLEDIAEEETGTTLRWDMGHLSEEEREKDEKRIDEDTIYEITPETGVHTAENRSNPTPGTKAPEPPKPKRKEVELRGRRRSQRKRFIPRKLFD